MLATTLALLLVHGPGDFALTRIEMTTLNELRETTPDIRRTIDLVLLREGTPVLKAKIPAAELTRADATLDSVLLPGIRPAPTARNWVGNQTKDYENETIDLTWQFRGQPIRWADFEGNTAVIFRNPGDTLIQSQEDAQDTLPGLMAKLLDLPKGIPPYKFYMKKQELPNGRTALTGYAALLKAEQDGFGVPFDVPREKQWATSIQVTVAERLVIFRFSYPNGGQGGGQGARPADYRRPNSRFNPPN